jgi:hypothetical protein
MPSDDTRRLLKTSGIAVTRYEDAVLNKSSMEEILEAEAEARARLQEVIAVIDRLRAVAAAS